MAAAILTLAAMLSACGKNTDGFDYSGTVQADYAAVGSTIGGRIVAILAADGQRVHKGDTILRFDDRQERAAYDNAVAQRAGAFAALRDLEAGPRESEIDKAQASAAQADAAYVQARLEHPQQVESARSALNSARADATSAHATDAKASRDLARSEQLYAEGAISAQALDAARSTAVAAHSAAASADARVQTAQTQLDSVNRGAAAQTVVSAANGAAAAQANLELVQAGARQQQVAQARASANAAAANVAAAAARLDEKRVVAPADGIVDGLDLHPGDLVAAGAPIARVDETGDPWVRIYVVQSDMQRVKVGAPVQIRSDALGGREFDGHVETIDVQAQFTPRDVQTAEDRADLAFGVKVRIHDPDGALRSGTTVEAALP